MVKSKQKYIKKNKQKTKKKIRGGKNPVFMKVVGYHQDGVLVKYDIKYGMDNEQQKKYADTYNIYYSTKTPLLGEILDMFDINPKKMKLKYNRFFSLNARNDPNQPVKASDYETIVIHHPEDIAKINIAKTIIENFKKITFSSPIQYDGKIPDFIRAYQKFINDNEKILLSGMDTEDGREILNTPVFLNIIGTHFKFIKSKLRDDLDKIKELMDSPGSASGSTSGPAAIALTTSCASPAPKLSNSTRISRELEDLIKS